MVSQEVKAGAARTSAPRRYQTDVGPRAQAQITSRVGLSPNQTGRGGIILMRMPGQGMAAAEVSWKLEGVQSKAKGRTVALAERAKTDHVACSSNVIRRKPRDCGLFLRADPSVWPHCNIYSVTYCHTKNILLVQQGKGIL